MNAGYQPKGVVLASDRVFLRPYRPDDLDTMLELWGDPAVVRFIGPPSTREDCWNRVLRYTGMWQWCGHGFWLVEERSTGRYIGEVGIADFARESSPRLTVPEAGWAVKPIFHGLGYASEALSLALDWADRTLRIPLVCMIDQLNTRSALFATRHGFAKAGTVDYRSETLDLFERPSKATE